MRLFLAIELEASVRARLASVQDRLRVSGADVRWVDPAGFHLTVLFLGELSDALLPAVQDAAAQIAAETPDFRFRVQGASGFPRCGPLKTVWVGLAEGSDSWRALARRAEEWFVPMGAPRAGNLAPHVTLGRVKSLQSDAASRAALAAEAQADCGSQPAGGIALIQSFLGREGAMYQNRGFWPLHNTEGPALQDAGRREELGASG